MDLGRALGIGLGLILILVCAYFFVPAFQQWIKDLFKSSPISGYSFISYRITYMDGTTRDFTPDTLTIFPMIITDASGKPISKITLMVNAVIQYTGKTIQSWSTNGKCYMDYYHDGTCIKQDQATGNLTASGSTWPSGQNTLIGQADIPSGQIEFHLKGYGHGYGAYEWRTTGQFTITITWTDGEQDSKTSQSLESKVNFNWSSALTVFSITVSSFPL